MIEVQGLKKHYKVARHHRGALGPLKNLFDPRHDEVAAVDDISFSIAAGEFVGFIGPNGAGKSTTVKVLTGVLEPSAGIVTVAGRRPRADRLAHVAHLGVVFGQRTQLWWDLPVVESYALLQHVYGIDDNAFRRQQERLVEMLEIAPLLDTPVRKLSLGQRMRCELAGALLHAPDLLFLDEPTIGLDVVAKETIRQFLEAENRERGTTILLTTHDMPDIERLCARTILIDRGRLVFDGAMDELRKRLGRERTLLVEFEGRAPDELPQGVREEDRGPERLLLRFDREAIAAPQLIAWLADKAPIRDLTLQEAPIEDIVAKIYREGLEGRLVPEASRGEVEAFD
ncbi:MAG: ATP-binding cassette domain-containing protein [Myxococcales bacterium]|nr:ATP-binding cassette domain-containing protein [Myxococcales bacterium]